MAFIAAGGKTFTMKDVEPLQIRPQPVMYLDYDDDKDIIAFLSSLPDAMDRLRLWATQQLSTIE